MPITLTSTGVEFFDATVQTTAASPTIGVGQTWQNVAASRAAGTTYTNTSGRTIQVGINSIGANAVLRVNGVIAAQSNVGNATNFIGALVPPSNTYQLQAGAPIGQWGELRV